MIIKDYNEKYLLVQHEYNRAVYNQIKAIPGAEWKKEINSWFVPVDKKDKLEKLYKKYYLSAVSTLPAQVGVIPPMPELTVDVPLKRTPFHFQAQGIAYALLHGNCIMADEPGLGKTTQAIGATVANQHLTGDAYPVLIICPNTLKMNWQKEWSIVADQKSIIMNDKLIGTWQQFFTSKMCNVFIANYESLRKYFVLSMNKPEGQKSLRVKDIKLRETFSMFKTIIIDESHRCKDTGTQQTKIVTRMAYSAKNVYALSGTPVVNETADLISQLYIIKRIGDLGGDDFFRARYCNSNKFLDELNYKLSTTCFYSRKKKDVLHELPDKMRQIVYCDITTRAEYNEALRDLENYLLKWKNKTEEEVDRSMRGEIMVKMQHCKRISARGKMEYACEIIDEVIAAKEKIIVFVHHHEIALELYKRYPHAVGVSGQQTMEQRQENIEAFQNNPKYNIIICSIKAAGVGITLTASSRVLFIEQPWHAADMDQCEDRAHRIGQKNSVQIFNLLGADTIDTHIHDIIEEKRRVSDAVTGNEQQYETDIVDMLANSMFNKNRAPEKV